MKTLIKSLLVVCALIFFAGSAAAELQPGKDYKMLNPAQPTRSGNKIEVLEFFYYGCSHCFHLHPELSAWEKKMPKDVELTYVPTIFNSSWALMARTFYALEMMGQQKRLHDDLYTALNVSNADLSDEDKIADFVAKRGVDRKKFLEAYNSFSMQSKVMRANQMVQSYGIRGTPTLVVDGKYVITGLAPTETIVVLNEVIDKVRKERAAKKH